MTAALDSIGRDLALEGTIRFGALELPLVAPLDVAGFREALRFAASEKLGVVPCGLGSKLAWIRAPRRPSFALSTRRFAGLASFEPDDGTLAARAGTTLSDLRSATRAQGRWATPNVPRPERATLGGTLSSGQSGPDRTRFGPARNHVLGMKVLLADGTEAKSGGQLVKNVTGYDLHRLYTGSFGSLCLILEAALRLFPEPEERAWLEVEVREARQALQLAERALDLPLRWLALTIVGCGSSWRVCGELGGKREVVDFELGEAQRVLHADALRGDAARTRSDETRDLAPCASRKPFARVTCRRSHLIGVVDELLGRAHALGALARLSIEPAVAEVQLELEPEHVDAFVGVLRGPLRARGCALGLHAAPSSSLAPFDPADCSDVEHELMRRLRARLDPDGLFAVGRFTELAR